MMTDTVPTIFKVLLQLKTAHSLVTQQKQFSLKTKQDLETLKQIQTVALDIVEIASEIQDRRV